MKADGFVKFMLVLIALFLGIIALRPLSHPPAAWAAAAEGTYLYVEPGTTHIRAPDGSMSQLGKVMVDLRNGNVWGFPTLTERPYPIDPTKAEPPVSHPVLLGRYDLSALDAGR